MNKIINKIKINYIAIFIAMLPVLDIATFFLNDTKFGSLLTLFRLVLLSVIFVYSYVITDNKKSHYIFTLVIFIYYIFHIVSCFYSGYINIFFDLSNHLRILYMPICLFSFIKIFNKQKDFDKQVKKGINLAFIIIALSIILALVTNTFDYTYELDYTSSLGITGWFYNKNTQSLILIVLSFICSLGSLKNNSFYFYASVSTLLLYFNGTKSTYISLICLILMLVFYSLLEIKDKKKIFYSVFLLCSVLYAYQFSPTYLHNNMYKSDQANRNEQISISIIDKNKHDKDVLNSGKDDLDISREQELAFYEEVYTMFSLKPLIDKFGIERVIKIYDYSVDAFMLSNTRLKKKNVAKLIYEDETLISHMFGFEFTKIGNMGNYSNGNVITFDLENDLTALFYYLGYVGFALYIGLILYYIYKISVVLLFNINYILKADYIMWIALTGILIFGAEYSGALLRMTNSNIYFSLVLAMAYVKFMKINNKGKKSKISFLALRLDYGGIETATINTANALCDKYDVEIISFYNFKDNQEKFLNSKVNVIHLFNGMPNREEFKNAWHKKQIIKILVEGIKSVKILFLKKYLIAKFIFNSDSKIIVSTRWDFSILLSKFKNKDTIAIAQEHHHHNNDKKYIHTLKSKYKNIDYLMALTPSLEKDYKEILANNKHIQIIVMPNMLLDTKDSKKEKIKNKNIVSVGRFHPDKRVDELIDMVANIKSYDNFYIIGDGDCFNDLKLKIDELGLNKKIHLLGYLDHNGIKKYYDKSSVFVMASLTEGLPMVLLEAMSNGVPCIAYETESGIKDIIEDGKNGYIIKNRNSLEFIKKLEYLLDDKNSKKYDEFSKNAISTSKEYSPEKVFKKWQKILEKYI